MLHLLLHIIHLCHNSSHLIYQTFVLDPNSEIETDDDVDIASTVTDQASLDDEENFGVLFFV